MKTIRRDQLRAGFVSEGEFVRVVNDDGSTHAFIIVPSDDRPKPTDSPPPCPRCDALCESVGEGASEILRLLALMRRDAEKYGPTPGGHELLLREIELLGNAVASIEAMADAVRKGGGGP